MYFETFAYKTAKGQIAVFVRNITERKNTENALQNAQKLESLGILAGGIAHDFNNMLCGLFGYIDLAKSYLSSNKAQDAARALSGALRSFEMLSSLANQLLTFSKGGAPCRKATALESIIKASGSLAVSGSNVRCRFDIAADLMACDCDGNQVSQVLTNIIINAKQAMPSGGEVVVTARNVVLLPDQNAHLPKGGNFIRISIKDHGVGIPLHILKNIFDPFFTTKETGHGLGLSTAFSIIKRHDGSIDVESEPGIGAVFHVYIPAATAAAPPDSEEIPEVYEGKGPVLVMDDDESIRSIYGDMIGLLGHTVVTAESGEEAIRLFKESIDANRPFCGTILDLTIKGGKGGMETLREIRRLQPRAKVVVASGYSNSPVMSNPSEMGFDGSLAKPFTTGDIVRLFRRIFT
jgi:nitrogen-specific signal transduction histidine kinase/CheY-like chemotaxis protein